MKLLYILLGFKFLTVIAIILLYIFQKVVLLIIAILFLLLLFFLSGLVVYLALNGKLPY
jgi:phosphatidylglycerophosphate synthase